MRREENIEKIIRVGFVWKFFERFGVLFTQFILQIILARMLAPDLYGALSIMLVFTSLANIFIQNGFNISLIQNKEVDEKDYSSVFWVTLIISFFFYVLLFSFSGSIAEFYCIPNIIWPFRILCFVLIPGAFNSIQLAILSRNLEFKKIFISNIVGTLFAAVISISMAYLGYGLWALVALNLSNTILTGFIMLITVQWRPKFIFNITRVKLLFGFGWKLMLSNIIDTLFQDLNNLIVGRFYTVSMLGIYNRGKQFPQAGITCIVGAIQSVMLPALAKLQDDKDHAKDIMRNVLALSSFFCFPIMAILAGIAEPLVIFLLTDKWRDSIIFLQIFCFVYSFWPIHVANLQAINAMGRSDIFLKLEIVKKIINLSLLFFAIKFFDTPIAIAGMGLLTTIIASFINGYPNRYLLMYSYSDQIRDILPYFIMSIGIFIILIFIETIFYDLVICLMVQLILAPIIYLGLCYYYKPYAFLVIISYIKKIKNGGIKI